MLRRERFVVEEEEGVLWLPKTFSSPGTVQTSGKDALRGRLREKATTKREGKAGKSKVEVRRP